MFLISSSSNQKSLGNISHIWLLATISWGTSKAIATTDVQALPIDQLNPHLQSCCLFVFKATQMMLICRQNWETSHLCLYIVSQLIRTSSTGLLWKLVRNSLSGLASDSRTITCIWTQDPYAHSRLTRLFQCMSMDHKSFHGEDGQISSLCSHLPWHHHQ